MRIRGIFLMVLAILMAASVLHAQNATSDTVGEQLKKVIESTTLDAKGMRPWHWKIDATLYDKDGKNPQQGGIEAWYDDGNMRTLLTLGGDQLTTLRIGNQLYRGSGDATKFIQLEVLFMDALHPIPESLLNPSVSLKLVPNTQSTPKMECIQSTIVPPHPGMFLGGEPLSYCMAADTGHYLVEYLSSHSSVARLRLGIFQSKEVPLELQVIEAGQKSAVGKTITIESFTPAPNEFQPGVQFQPLGDTVEVPQASRTMNLLLYKEQPHYPAEAKDHHIAGSVKFDVMIGTDGRLLSKTAANKASPVLYDEAARVVSYWVYRPYLVNGLPVKVKTTITINFYLNGG